MRVTPAEHVIKQIGGVRKTARAILRTPPSISAWRKPRAEGGTGGDIPGAAHKSILIYAKKERLDITPEDLILGREVSKRKSRSKRGLSHEPA